MDSKLQLIISLLSGITLGAVVAILFTPEKGKDNYKNMVNFTREFAHDFITQGKEGLEASIKRWPN
ncbi:MAG: YtxH domain-containing protein [Bacteroidota bacterium]|nr:YtxH domain-containing protein [Bacteroidota bacterium]